MYGEIYHVSTSQFLLYEMISGNFSRIASTLARSPPPIRPAAVMVKSDPHVTNQAENLSNKLHNQKNCERESVAQTQLLMYKCCIRKVQKMKMIVIQMSRSSQKIFQQVSTIRIVNVKVLH